MQAIKQRFCHVIFLVHALSCSSMRYTVMKQFMSNFLLINHCSRYNLPFVTWWCRNLAVCSNKSLFFFRCYFNLFNIVGLLHFFLKLFRSRSFQVQVHSLMSVRFIDQIEQITCSVISFFERMFCLLLHVFCLWFC